MDIYWLIIASVGGILAGSIISWLICRPRMAILHDQLAIVREDLTHTQTILEQKNDIISELHQSIVRLETILEHERKTAHEKIAILNEATVRLQDAFKALSAEALRSNNQTFLELAKTTL